MSSSRIHWPEGKTFAFTIFDDPDSQTLEDGERIYGLLGDLGFRTTKGVWPSAPMREPNSPGATCGDAGYRRNARSLQSCGFEIGYHLNTAHSSTREEICEGLDRFRNDFGTDPAAMANHYNAEAIYWGPARVTGLRRAIYNTATLGRNRNRYFGHVEGHPSFWGDICKRRIRYCRNFVFLDINTLKACPHMPYYDPLRPYVNFWYASTEGSNCTRFVRAIAEPNQDRLEAEGGACIMYTHFGHGYVQNGRIDNRFRSLISRLSKKNGWFVPVSALLDYLRSAHPHARCEDNARAHLEQRWLFEKFFRGTS